MNKEEQKEFDKVVEERDNARRHAARLRKQLAGTLSLLALHGIDLKKLDEEL